MATQPRLKIVKSFSYRGATRLFSNSYFFGPNTPADDAHWDNLIGNVVVLEKTIYPSTVTIVEAVCYDGGSDLPVFSETLSTAGTLTVPGDVHQLPGDVAALLRWDTDTRTVKNHPLYLFNYYHAAMMEEGDPPDNLYGAQNSAIADYAQAWIDGISDGVHNAHRYGPNGAIATDLSVQQTVTHRDFPR